MGVGMVEAVFAKKTEEEDFAVLGNWFVVKEAIFLY